MKDLYELIKQAKEYRDSYEQSGVKDNDLLYAIFVQHLAYLLNH